MNLNKFYKRVKPFPQLFLKKLASEIYCELFNFDAAKIERIACELACRMNKEDSELLITSLRSKYQIGIQMDHNESNNLKLEIDEDNNDIVLPFD